MRTLSLSFTSPSVKIKTKKRWQFQWFLSLWIVENSKFVHIWYLTFLGFSEKESYSYYWFTKIGRSDTTKSRKFFEMKIRTEEGEIFHFYFCQFFLSIYRRSQGEIALNQTLIYSASTVFIQQLTSSSYLQRATSS